MISAITEFFTMFYTMFHATNQLLEAVDVACTQANKEATSFCSVLDIESESRVADATAAAHARVAKREEHASRKATKAKRK